MNNVQMYIKLVLVGILSLAVFILAGMGKLDAQQAVNSVVLLVGSLVIALGISGGVAQALKSPDVQAALHTIPPPAPPPMPMTKEQP